MARKIRHEHSIQKSGNILRTVMIWTGIVLAVVAALLLLIDHDNERAALICVIIGMITFGFALHDFDTDDDD